MSWRIIPAYFARLLEAEEDGARPHPLEAQRAPRFLPAAVAILELPLDLKCAGTRLWLSIARQLIRTNIACLWITIFSLTSRNSTRAISRRFSNCTRRR